MKKCILPTDYSRSAKAAIDYALQLMQHLPKRAECLLVHAYTAPATVPVYGYNPPGKEKPPLEQEQQQMDTYVGQWQERYPDTPLQGRLLIGSFLTVLSNLIQEEPDADMVIMGTKGASGMEEVLLGSNAARAARSLPRPVLIIPHDTPFQKPERVVFATDFRKLGKLKVLDPLRVLVQHLDPHFMSLHVLPQGKTPDSAKEAMNHRLHDYFENTRYSHHYLEGDDTVQAIASFVKKYKADMLVLIGKERGFFESLFHRSVVQQMAFHTKVPLLVLKEH